MAILTGLAALRAPAADTPAAPLTPDCRYLFIVDTSLSMTRLQESVAFSISRLVASGMDGQMAPGEVFTIWTFNEDLQQYEFPLTSWSPDRGEAMAERVGEFLRSRRFRRTADMRTLINGVYQAKRFCPRLAVFLVTNGEEVLVGTPFDRNINVIYGRRFEELKAARVPFLTTLLCQNGEVIAWANQAANEPLDLPSGPGGAPVVGRRRQPLSGNPEPVAASPKPALGPVTNALALLPQDSAQPAPKSMDPPPESIVPKPGPSAPAARVDESGRKVVELSAPVDPDAPKVVKPTDIAPAPKVDLPKLPIKKAEAPQVPPATTDRSAAAPKPSFVQTSKPVAAPEPKADPPAEIGGRPGAMPAPPSVKKATETLANLAANADPDAVAGTPEARAAAVATLTGGDPAGPTKTNQNAKPKPPATRAPDVVFAVTSAAALAGMTKSNVTAGLNIVTQVVNVAFPPKPPAKKSEPPPPAKPSPTEKKESTGKPSFKTDIAKAEKTGATGSETAPKSSNQEGTTSRPQTNLAAEAAPAAAPVDTNSFAAAPQKRATNFAGVAISGAKPAAARPVEEGLTITAPEPRSRMQWIYLSAAVLLLMMAGLTGWKLLSQPIDASLISQSMEDRDNG